MGQIFLHPITGSRLTFPYCTAVYAFFFFLFFQSVSWVLDFWRVVWRNKHSSSAPFSRHHVGLIMQHLSPALPFTLVCHHRAADSFMLPSTEPLQSKSYWHTEARRVIIYYFLWMCQWFGHCRRLFTFLLNINCSELKTLLAVQKLRWQQCLAWPSWLFSTFNEVFKNQKVFQFSQLVTYRHTTPKMQLKHGKGIINIKTNKIAFNS